MKRMFMRIGCIGLLCMVLLTTGTEYSSVTWRELLFPATVISGLLLAGAYGPRLPLPRRKKKLAILPSPAHKVHKTAPHSAA